MKKIANSLIELIGKTPLLLLTNFNKEYAPKSNIIAKLEYFNPAGSAKDRIAKAMLEDAEARGIIGAGSVIIEPTSGNTGIGLAAVAAAKGYKAIFTMPESNLLKSSADTFGLFDKAATSGNAASCANSFNCSKQVASSAGLAL